MNNFKAWDTIKRCFRDDIVKDENGILWIKDKEKLTRVANNEIVIIPIRGRSKKEVEILLKEYPDLMKWISEINMELCNVKQCKADLENNLKATMIKEAPGGSGLSDPTNQAVEKIMDMVDEFEKHIEFLTGRINELLRQKGETANLLRLLTPKEYKVIELRYFKKKTWTEVLEIVDCQKRQIMEMNFSALKKMVI